MQLNGSENIWKELDSLYESELNELARFNKRGESLKEFRKHFEKHKEVLDKDGKVVYTYKTEDEYDEAAHELSSFPATPIGGKWTMMCLDLSTKKEGLLSLQKLYMIMLLWYLFQVAMIILTIMELQ